MLADDVITVARAAIGTPFRHQGRRAGSGLDCVGLACHVACTLGIQHVDRHGYERQPANGLLDEAIDEQPSMVRVPLADLHPGDLLVMRFHKMPQHLAIYAGATLIHAWQPAGKVCEHVIDDSWRRRIVRAYRFTEAA